jgi:hypothetical protein
VALLGGPSTSPLDVMLRLTSLVLLSMVLVSSYAVGAEQSTEKQAKIPSHLNTSIYGGGDGLSKKTAVIVKSRDQYAGVRSEYAWIASRYPGSKPISRELTARDDRGRNYDVITVRTSARAKIVLWFDVSAMYQ